VRALYYALGGGHGHALRGLAVLSRLAADRADPPGGRPGTQPGDQPGGPPGGKPIDAALIAPAAFGPWARALGVRLLSPPPDGVGADAIRGWIARLPAPDLLLVDVFPRGVAADLLPLLGRAPAWLVSRRVRPDYYLHPAVRGAIEAHFELVLWTEAPAGPLRALRVPQLDLPPMLLGAPPLSRAGARRRLGVAADRPLVLGVGSGEPAQQARLCRLLGKIAGRAGAALRFVSAELAGDAAPGDPDATGHLALDGLARALREAGGAARGGDGDQAVIRAFPAAALLPAADAVVSAAGYHAFHEAAALGAPAVFVPQRRRFDDQVWRARDAVVATDPPSLEAAVRRLLREGWLTVGHGPLHIGEVPRALRR